MDHDDEQVGRVLSRREVLALLGAAAAATLAACSSPAAPTRTLAAPTSTLVASTSTLVAPTSTLVAPTSTLVATSTRPPATSTLAATTAATETARAAATTVVSLPACIVRPAQTEGPYFVDEMLNRADLRSDPTGGAADRAGVPLALTLRVSQLNGTACAPLAGAQVDLWHCDAEGVYSGVGSAAGQHFLRGYQVTDAAGQVTFTTIYPGWYAPRTTHLHFKIRTDPAAAQGLEFTSQLYFDEAVNDAVFAQAPYSLRGERGTRNATDFLYSNGGDQLLLSLTPSDQGYAAIFDIGLQIS